MPMVSADRVLACPKYKKEREPALPLQSATTIPAFPVVVPLVVVVVWKAAVMKLVFARYRMPLGRLTALLTAEAPIARRLTAVLKVSRADKSSVAWLPLTLPLPIQTWRLAAVLETF